MSLARLLSGVVLAVMVLLASPAHAHAIGVSRGVYGGRDGRVSAQLSFARGEIAALAPAIDANRDGTVDATELSLARAALQRAVIDAIRVTADGSACPGALDDVALTEQDGAAVTGHFTCPGDARSARVDLAVLGDLAHGHRHLAHVDGTPPADVILFRGESSFPIAFAPGAATTSGGRAGGPLSLVSMGVQHILTGYDHLVFLLGLVLVGGRTRALLGVVTAFTAAHSITLALAVLGVWAPSPRVVEPAIALSIAYVGLENLFVKSAEKRWRITFPFGLVHGFGFAGALREIALPQGEIPLALVSFNVGVELGQLAVLGIALPLLAALRRTAWLGARAVRAASGAVVVAGVSWFVVRVVGGV